MRKLLALLALSALVPVAASADGLSRLFGGDRSEMRAEMVTVSILPGWREADGRHVAGLQIALAEGWKTYWRAPGEAGLPPQVDWSGSRNLVDGELQFPRPTPFDTSGMVTFGYEDTVVLPLDLQTARSGAPVTLSMKLEFAVCESYCMPLEANLRATLPPRGVSDPRIMAALEARPQPRSLDMDCRLSPSESGFGLAVSLRLPAGFSPATMAVVELDQPRVWVADTETRIAGGRIEAQTALRPYRGAPLVVDRTKVRISLFDGRRAVEATGC